MVSALKLMLACLLAVASCTDPRSDAGCTFSWKTPGCSAGCKLKFKPWFGTLGPCVTKPPKAEKAKAAPTPAAEKAAEPETPAETPAAETPAEPAAEEPVVEEAAAEEEPAKEEV